MYIRCILLENFKIDSKTIMNNTYEVQCNYRYECMSFAWIIYFHYFVRVENSRRNLLIKLINS